MLILKWILFLLLLLIYNIFLIICLIKFFWEFIRLTIFVSEHWNRATIYFFNLISFYLLKLFAKNLSFIFCIPLLFALLLHFLFIYLSFIIENAFLFPTQDLHFFLLHNFLRLDVQKFFEFFILWLWWLPNYLLIYYIKNWFFAFHVFLLALYLSH